MSPIRALSPSVSPPSSLAFIIDTQIAVVLNQQSLSVDASSPLSQFNHHVSLLKSRSDSQRRDSLAYLTSAVTTRTTGTPLPQPVNIFLPALLPLTLDGSNSVRKHLIGLLRSLPPGEIEDHVEQLVLYIRAGMTHLAADIRCTAVEILEWILEAAGREVVSCAGGWVKTLRCFLALLGWQADDNRADWSGTKVTFGKAGSDGKSFVRSLTVLASFLRAGLDPGFDQTEEESPCTFPLWQWQCHTLPTQSHCYRQLSLFGAPRDSENGTYEDRDERQRVFATKFQRYIAKGLDATKKEGGEVGRAAATVAKAVVEGMADFNIDS